MLVPIESASGQGLAAWAMIEMQGEIERKDQSNPNEGFDVGTLSLTGTGTVHLTIGYHQLEGKVQELKKPLAVLSRVESPGDGAGGEAEPCYEVIGVVKEKYLFKNRPRALITKPEGRK